MLVRSILLGNPYTASQQTQTICITFVQRQPSVFDVGPTLFKWYTTVLFLLGSITVMKIKNKRQVIF